MLSFLAPSTVDRPAQSLGRLPVMGRTEVFLRRTAGGGGVPALASEAGPHVPLQQRPSKQRVREMPGSG